MAAKTTPQPAYAAYLKAANLTTLPHQVEGVNWCLSKETEGFESPPSQPKIYGGLIADEMGLGKTIQIIGTMLCNPKKRTLIVLPRALLEQWTNFIKKTTDLSVYLYHGSNRDTNVSIKELKQYQVVITTYGLVATHSIRTNNPKDPDNKAPTTLHAIHWSRVIFDEAHNIRNKTTASHNGACKLSANIRWLITGTPIQNSIKDFYNLCEVIGIKSAFYEDQQNIEVFIENLLLKRTKAEVNLKLPKLKLHEIEVPWQNEQEKKLAQEIHARLKFSNTEAPTNSKVSNRLPSSALPLLARSRQLCVLPALVKKKLRTTNSTPTAPEPQDGKISDNSNPAAQAGNPCSEIDTDRFIDEATGHTSKLNAVIKKIISKKDNGRNKLIFCHYHDEIDFIKSLLTRLEIKTSTFDGRISQEDRDKILTDKTNQVLILQIKTGCEGLNLQQYSEIYFISPHWNPAIEDQAIARAYRIGQEKTTHVYRFKMEPFDKEKTTITLDEHACHIQEKKRETMKILTNAHPTPNA